MQWIQGNLVEKWYAFKESYPRVIVSNVFRGSIKRRHIAISTGLCDTIIC